MSRKIPFNEFGISEFNQFLSNIKFPINISNLCDRKKFFFSNNNECWDWNLYKNPRGYGEFKHQRSNRCSYFFFNDKDPGNLLVCHSCDNPSCVNPNHLWLGTNDQNSKDMIYKGRSVSHIGENSGSSKLTELEVLSIFKDIEDGVFTSFTQICKYYSISEAQLSRILKGVQWSHLKNLLPYDYSYYRNKIIKILPIEYRPTLMMKIIYDYSFYNLSKAKLKKKYKIGNTSVNTVINAYINGEIFLI